MCPKVVTFQQGKVFPGCVVLHLARFILPIDQLSKPCTLNNADTNISMGEGGGVGPSYMLVSIFYTLLVAERNSGVIKLLHSEESICI